MQLPLRSYYYQPKRKAVDPALKARIEDICLEFPKYGYRRVTKQLHREGVIVNYKKIARIMKENGLNCHPHSRKWIRTTDSKHGYRIYPNLIADGTVKRINQVWVADIT